MLVQHAARRLLVASTASPASGTSSPCLEGTPLAGASLEGKEALQLMVQTYALHNQLFRMITPMDVDAVLDLYIESGK